MVLVYVNQRTDFKMRKNLLIIISACVLLAGCANNKENTNLLEGMSYIEELNYQNALDSFAAGRENGEDEELLLRGEGIAYMGLGQYEDARDSFLNSIYNAGNSVTSLEVDTNFYLASSYVKLEDYESAKEIYSAILKFQSKDSDAYFLRGVCNLKLGEKDLATEDFNQAMTLENDDVDLTIDIYKEFLSAGYEDDGTNLLNNIMETKSDVLTKAQKGTIYYYLEDYEDARIFLDQAVTDGETQMNLLLGRTYEKLGDMNYAGVVYQAYLDAGNVSAEVYNALGICLMSQGKVAEAITAFQSGIDLGNSDSLQNLKFNLIVAYEKNSDFTTAKQLMEEYLSFYPDDSKALREYEFLKTR